MDAMETLAAGIKHVDGLLDEAVLEPDVDRTDWAGIQTRIAMVREGIDQQIACVLEEALAAASNDEVRGIIRSRVASLYGCAAALLHVSGDNRGALTLLTHALKVARDDTERAELTAGDAELRVYARLQHARWLLFHRRRSDADRVAKVALREAKAEALRSAARKVLQAPRPIDRAPALFRINGCGVGLYGERDKWKDGFYVATYCLCILFVPVFPLTAYRVRRADRGWQFLARERLGPVARAWQGLFAVAAAVALGWGSLASYRDSPARKASVAFDAARAAEASGDRGAALAGYTAVVRQYPSSEPAAPAAESVVRLSAAAVPEPCTVDALDKVTKVVDAFHELPPQVRAGAPAALLTQRLEAWADQIGDGTAEQAHAELTLLDHASRIASSGAASDEVAARRNRIRRELGDKLVAARPLQALALYVQVPADAGVLAKAGAIVDGFGEAPSLWIEAERDVATFASAAEKQADLRDAAARARTAVRKAHEAHALDAPLIEAGVEKPLVAALARSPRDQELAVAVAQIQRHRGDLKAALTTLEALGAPGRMTAAVQQLLAGCVAEAGDLPRADRLLGDLLAERLPAFQQAQREYAGAAGAIESAALAEAKAGRFEGTLKSRLDAAGKDDGNRVFGEWLSEKMQHDPRLTSLREEYLRHGVVVPAALAHGIVKLRRANAASGEERKALLGAAEKVFLSIRHEAEGNPGFHLALGQVYHRLGRTEDGNAELKRLLDEKDPELMLQVANVYRDLGLPVRAKQIAEQVWNTTAETRWKQQAASALSRLVNEVGFNEDEEETWLKRCDQTSPHVQLEIQGLEARRLRRQGKMIEADRVYAHIAEAHERDAGHNPVAANNAAIAYLERYGTTGDPAHLRAAVKHLEAAHRLTPQDALVAGNLADALDYAGTVAVLERWVRMRTLTFDNGEVLTLLTSIVAGPLHDEALAAIRQNPLLRRSLDVDQEAQALAPQKAAGYGRQLRWLLWSRDDKGLVELRRRLLAMPRFDPAAVAEGRKAYREKTKDDRDRLMTAETVKRAKETVERARHAGHAPTLAAALLVLMGHEGVRVRFDATPENVDAVLDAMRQAAQSWADGTEEALPGVLIATALYRAAAESPAVAKALDAEVRVHGSAMLVHRLITGPDGATALAALRGRPELLEAARLRKARLAGHPAVLDVVLARVVGDAEMEQAAAAVFQRADLGADLAIEALLYPGQEMETAELSFFESGGR